MRIVNSASVQESPYTYNQKVNHFGGTRWEAEVTIRPLDHYEALQFKAFFASLKGRLGTFMLGNPLDIAPSNHQIQISEASLGDETVDLSVSNMTYYAGQTIQIGNHLHMMFSNMATGSYTNVAITPPLRQNIPASGENAVIDEPNGKWRLSTNAIEFDVDKAGMYGFTFSCVEAL